MSDKFGFKKSLIVFAVALLSLNMTAKAGAVYDYIKANNLSICLDVSHLVMAASYHKQDWKLWYNELVPYSGHIHISDAADSKSEGLMFGEGIIGDFSEILALKKLKIIECWQGHINQGEGFKDSLQNLYGQFNVSRN